ncbi:MAG: methionine--tRNA ligase [Microgenomates group bacterium]
MAKKFYITTAIDYTNDVVHVGHSYQKILADALARYHRLLEERVFFLTGTDEHGQKVEKSAKESGLPPKKFVDKIVKADKKEWKSLNLSYNRFIRTTDKDHIKFAQEIYLKSKASGDIYKAKYKGFYCEGCEGYISKHDLINGHCPFHPNLEPLKIEEENYFFRLSKYQKFLEELLEKNKKLVIPEGKRKEALSFVKRGLKDFAVSRPGVSWGIPVPDDPSHTIYVWFDALINYLTYGVEENCWPADVHVLGKDNLRFHAIYWPAMLKSAGYPLPKTILVHDFLTFNGQKISKSLGNVIRPSELVKKFGTDAVRYFFLRFGPLQNDIDFTLEKIKEAYNADLANGLGNLVARIAKLCEKANFKAPYCDDTYHHSRFKKFHKLMLEYKINEALEFVWQKISQADKYINTSQPWLLKGEKLNRVLGHLVKEIREIAILLKPFLPETAEKIAKQFSHLKIKSAKPLFPRIQ